MAGWALLGFPDPATPSTKQVLQGQQQGVADPAWRVRLSTLIAKPQRPPLNPGPQGRAATGRGAGG